MFKVGIAVVGLVVTTAIVAGISYAQNNQENGEGKFNAKNQEILGTIEDNDFAGWKQAMKNRGVDENLLTEENFNKMAEAHRLMQAGKFEEARQIKESMGELGLGRKGIMQGKNSDPEKREAVMAALENKDYQAWREAVGNERADQVTADEFPRLIEANKLMQQGQEKFKQARNIKQEIGLKAGANRMMRHNW